MKVCVSHSNSGCKLEESRGFVGDSTSSSRIIETSEIIAKRTLHICRFNHYFIDIGIPEDYERFVNTRF